MGTVAPETPGKKPSSFKKIPKIMKDRLDKIRDDHEKLKNTDKLNIPSKE